MGQYHVPGAAWEFNLSRAANESRKKTFAGTPFSPVLHLGKGAGRFRFDTTLYCRRNGESTGPAQLPGGTLAVFPGCPSPAGAELFVGIAAGTRPRHRRRRGSGLEPAYRWLADQRNYLLPERPPLHGQLAIRSIEHRVV